MRPLMQLNTVSGYLPFALDHLGFNCAYPRHWPQAVVIANGYTPGIIASIVAGKRVGTLFNAECIDEDVNSPRDQAVRAREQSRNLNKIHHGMTLFLMNVHLH